MEHCQGFCKTSTRSHSMHNRKRKESQNLQHKEELMKVKSDHQFSVSLQKNNMIYYEDQLAILRDYYHTQLISKDQRILELQEFVKELQCLSTKKRHSHEKYILMTPSEKGELSRDKSISNEPITSLKKDLMRILRNQNESPTEKSNTQQYETRIKNLIGFIKKYRQQCNLAYKKEKLDFKNKIFRNEKMLFQKDQIISNFERQNKESQTKYRSQLGQFKTQLEDKQQQIKLLNEKQQHLKSELQNYKTSYQTLQTAFSSYKQNQRQKYNSSQKEYRKKFDTIAKKIQSPISQEEQESYQLLKTQQQQLIMEKQALELKLNMNINRCEQLNGILLEKQIEIKDLKHQLFQQQYQKNKWERLNKNQKFQQKDKQKWIAQAKQENKKLYEKLGQFQSLLKLQKEEKEKMVKRLQEKNLNESQQMKYIQQLQCENEALKQQILVIKRQLQQYSSQQKSNQEQIKSKKNEINLLIAKVDDLQLKLHKTLQEANNAKKQFMVKFLDNQQILIERQQLIRGLEDNIRNAQNQIRQFQMKLESVKLQVAAQFTEKQQILHRDFQQKLVNMEQQFKVQQKKYQFQTHEQYVIMEKAYNQTVALREQVKKLNLQNNHFQAEIQQLTISLQVKNKEVAQLQSIIKKIKANNEEKMIILQKQLTDANEEKTYYKKQLAEYQQKYSKKQQQLNELRQKLMQIQQKSSNLERINTEYAETIKKQQLILEENNQEKSQTQTKIEEGQEKIQFLTTQISQVKKQLTKQRQLIQTNLQIIIKEFQEYRSNCQQKDKKQQAQKQALQSLLNKNEQQNILIKGDYQNVKQKLKQVQDLLNQQKISHQLEVQKLDLKYKEQTQKLTIQYQQKLILQVTSYQQQRNIFNEKIQQLLKKIETEYQQKRSKPCQCYSQGSTFTKIQINRKNNMIHKSSHSSETSYIKSNQQIKQLRAAYDNAKKSLEEYQDKYPKLLQKYKIVRQKWMQYYKNIGQLNLDDFLIHSQSKSFLADHHEEGYMGKMNQIQVQQSIIIRSTNQDIYIQEESVIQTELIGGRLRNTQMQQSIIYQEQNEQTTTKKLISPEQLKQINIPENVKRKLPNQQDQLMDEIKTSRNNEQMIKIQQQQHKQEVLERYLSSSIKRQSEKSVQNQDQLEQKQEKQDLQQQKSITNQEQDH